MADLTEPLDLPFIFIDPYLKIVDRAFPLECHKKPKQYLKYYSEDQVLKRTNDFRPTEFSLNKKLKKTSKKIVIDVPELGHLFKDDLVRLLRDDMKITRKFERHDPLRENALVTMDFSHDLKLFISASASSLSTLIIIVSKKEQFELDDSSVELPLDTMYIAETYDLEYPIRQITTSPFSSLDFKIFIVRTTSKLHLFTLDTAEGLRMIHVFDLAKTTDMFPSIDYSMPMHVEMSPYYPYQYLVVTTNGYTAVVDGTNSEILFNGMDPFLDDHNYTSRWKSCAFGKTPSTILIASPECIKEWEFTDDTIHKRTIAAPNDRIVAFTAKSTLYCIATIGAIILFDHLVPERPILKWTHPIRLGTPSLLTLNELEKDVWRITAFSHQTQKLTFMDFHYTNRPTKSIIPKANVIGLHNIKLSKYKFQELYNHTSRISSVGFEIESCPLVKGDDNSGRLFCIYRLFEDGSLKVQYVTLTENGPVDRKDIGNFMTKPEYALKPFNAHFKQILSRLALDTVPHRQKKHVYTEVYNMNVSTFDNYLNKKVEAGNEELSSELKEHVASNVRQMKEPTSFRNLFEENGHHYESYEREGLKRFLEELKTFEDIDCIYLNSDLIPQLGQNSQSLNTELHKKLDDAYQKEIQMSTAVLLPRFYDDSKVHYFNRERVKFLSSVTSKVLASCWKVGNADYKNIPFPQLDFSAKLRAEEFPRFGDSRSQIKRRRSSEIKMPIITVEEENPDEQASSMPIVKVETVTAPKKKRTVKHETHTDVVPRSSSPPRPSSQPDHLLPPSPARAFTSISTQPAPGVYGSRKKAVTKKKKKPKASGFK